METREYHTQDKSTWGDGPWQQEPDKRQWPDEETGLPCLIVRSVRLGNLCGYVGVPRTHPAYGKSYSYCAYDSDWNRLTTSPTEEAIDAIEVYGGLTFASACLHGQTEAEGICHVPSAGELDEMWWFGFDCAHAWDTLPAMNAMHPELCCPDTEYRDVAFVTAECRKLAQQLAAIGVLTEIAALGIGIAGRA